MLVTFRTKAYSNISVFAELAELMLRMAGHGGSIPGAFSAEDVPAAHARLRQAMIDAKARTQPAPGDRQDEDEQDSPAAMRDRALRMGEAHPLVQLFAAAAAKGSEVAWSAGAPVL